MAEAHNENKLTEGEKLKRMTEITRASVVKEVATEVEDDKDYTDGPEIAMETGLLDG